MTPTQKARDAAIFAQDMAYQLLAASTPGTTHEAARQHITKAFTSWPSLTRRMAELAELCPNCSSEGQLQADKIRDISERPQTPGEVG